MKKKKQVERSTAVNWAVVMFILGGAVTSIAYGVVSHLTSDGYFSLGINIENNTYKLGDTISVHLLVWGDSDSLEEFEFVEITGEVRVDTYYWDWDNTPWARSVAIPLHGFPITIDRTDFQPSRHVGGAIEYNFSFTLNLEPYQFVGENEVTVGLAEFRASAISVDGAIAIWDQETAHVAVDLKERPEPVGDGGGRIGKIALTWDGEYNLLTIKNSELSSTIRDPIIKVDRGPIVLKDISEFVPEDVIAVWVAENIIKLNGDLLGTKSIYVLLAYASFVEVDDLHGGTDILGEPGAEPENLKLDRGG